MGINLTISDSQLAGFSAPAVQQLEKSIFDFSTDLIDEANRLEAALRGDANSADINAAMICDADRFVRRGLVKRKEPATQKIAKVSGSTLALFTGFLWDKSSLSDNTYLVTFGALFMFTLFVNTYIIIKE